MVDQPLAAGFMVVVASMAEDSTVVDSMAVEAFMVEDSTVADSMVADITDPGMNPGMNKESPCIAGAFLLDGVLVSGRSGESFA